MRVILASKSPRRIEYLKGLKIDFETIPSTLEENMNQKLPLNKLSESLASQKAEDVFNQTDGDRLVIGSDTMVIYKNKKFGKPKDDNDAKEMLKCLSNRWHKVYTSLCVLIEKNGKTKKYLTYDVCKVKFKKLTNDMIEKYLIVGEHKDKAGAYGMQGYSGGFVEKINGNYSTVIGLPMHKLYDILLNEEII